jgi:hypothetical protein
MYWKLSGMTGTGLVLWQQTMTDPDRYRTVIFLPQDSDIVTGSKRNAG